MAPLVLEGNTLGQKHQNYNKLVDEALKSNYQPEPIEESEDDIKNLLNIDVACKKRNVDFIIEVLKSEDQLYVSKAIKRSTWLFTDPQYAHIINPEHLYTKLYPQMTSRAFNKLMLNIRLHLKEETRVEAFYNYIKEKLDKKAAFKWLQHCSVPLVEKEVAYYTNDIPETSLLRLFEKSFSIYEIYSRKIIDSYCYTRVNEVEFLLKNNTVKFLDFLESANDRFYFSFREKGTTIIMETCPERILDKFEFYGRLVHLATFAKLLKKREDIKEFLLKHANNRNLKWLYAYDKIQHFIKQIPKESRFEFVKRVFIDKEVLDKKEDGKDECDYTPIALRAAESSKNSSQVTHIYIWYKYAPFEIAFTDLKKLIRAESIPVLRNSMILVLLSCAGKNMQHIRTVLQFYHDKHINEPFKFKIQFVNSFISKVNTHTLDDEAWNILCQLFYSMDVYIQSENNVQFCIRAIIVRHVIRNEQVPDIIINKFKFDTLKTYQNKLSKQEEKDAVFGYLRDHIAAKSNSLNLTLETEFDNAVTQCEHLLNLIKDWGKDLKDHPYALDRVKVLIKVKKDKQWDRDLSSLYKTKKSWKREMFEESVTVMPSEKVYVNALKHDPGLLSRNKEEIVAMCCNNNVSLRHLLSKMRIYWPHTMAKDWRTTYLKRLDQEGGHKALIIDLCTLLPRAQINDLLKKYVPITTKIDWNETDQIQLSLRKQIARNVHRARPQPPVEAILPYAKGDYLQYAVPSLSAILSQLSPSKSRQCIPKLLDAPVSLQKFGVRCAFYKLTSEELKPMLSQMWNDTQNSTIRTVLFLQTFEMMCEKKNASYINDIWDLLSMFIDKLTPDDNKLLFNKLGDISKLPDSIQPQFLMKSFSFLSSLPAKCNCESILDRMQSKATNFMESLDDEFVINIMLKNVNENFTKERNIYGKACIITSFILGSKDEEMQVGRYEKSLSLILEQHLPQWELVIENKYRIREHVKTILEMLIDNLETYTFENKLQIPVKAFEMIKSKLESTLSYKKDYLILTIWKLATTFVRLLNENKHVIINSEREIEKHMTDKEKDKMYNETHELIAPQFAKICVQYLKEDLNSFGASMYSLFSVAFKTFLREHMSRTVCQFQHRLLYAKGLMECGNEKEIYFIVHSIFVDELYNYDNFEPETKKIVKETYDKVMSNGSDEIKMHFYNLFENIAISSKHTNI